MRGGRVRFFFFAGRLTKKTRGLHIRMIVICFFLFWRDRKGREKKIVWRNSFLLHVNYLKKKKNLPQVPGPHYFHPLFSFLPPFFFNLCHLPTISSWKAMKYGAARNKFTTKSKPATHIVLLQRESKLGKNSLSARDLWNPSGFD